LVGDYENISNIINPQSMTTKNTHGIKLVAERKHNLGP